MDYKAILDSWIGNTCQESPSLWYQCVALSKQFAKDIWNPIKWFSGSALKGWQTWSPFDDKWERVTYEKWKVPKLGDIFFLDKTSKNPYGHTWVVYEWSTPETMVVVEQNAGTGNGDGKGGNAITKRSYGYNTSRGRVLWWFTLKTNLWNTMSEQKSSENVSKFKEIYIQERPRGYEPIFSDLSGIEIATISDIKYLIEIANIRSSKK